LIYNPHVRTVCFALLFANLVYFAWAHWVDVPRPPAVNPQVAHLPQLKLVEQLPPSQRPQAGAEKMTLDGGCLTLGPFETLDNSAHAAALLQAKGFDARQRAEGGQTTDGYWVYIGGLKTQADADQALETLERAGITDALVMPETTEVGRRLSLGLYSERTRADRRAQTARQVGLDAQIVERKLPASAYWLDLTLPPGNGTVPLEDLFAEGVSPRITLQPCPPPATLAPRAATPASGTTTAASPNPLREPATASNPPGSGVGPPNLP